MKFTALLLSAPLLLAACHDIEQPTPKPTPDPASCTINGIQYDMEFYGRQMDNGQFNFWMKYPPGEKWWFWLNVNNIPDSIGQFDLQTWPNDHAPNALFETLDYDVVLNSYRIWPNPDLDHWFSISKLDTVAKTVEGEFALLFVRDTFEEKHDTWPDTFFVWQGQYQCHYAR